MDNAIVTFYIVNSNQSLDIEIPINISINNCIDVLCAANLLPASDSYLFDVSDAGEHWEEVDASQFLKEVIVGDGSIIRIREKGQAE